MFFIQKYFQFFKRIAKWLLGREVIYKRQIRCKTIKLGNKFTDWSIVPDGLSSLSIIYSFGLEKDVSFEVELIKLYGVTIHAFDPTPRSIEFVKSLNLTDQFILHEFGIADFDGNAIFYAPKDPTRVSHTIVPRSSRETSKSIEVPVYRLTTIMKMLGHNKIDLLKMDIEGAEYGVIQDLKDSNISISQLCLEFHHRWPEVGIKKTKKAISQINIMGFKIFDVSPSGLEYSFIVSSN